MSEKAAILVDRGDTRRMFLLAGVYCVFAFAEVLVLFASVAGLLVLAVRLTVRAIDAFLDGAIEASSLDARRRAGKASRLNLAAEGRFHRIPGGHNEHY